MLKKTEPVLCIDPGTTHSGVVVFDGENILYSKPDFDNNELIKYVAYHRPVKIQSIVPDEMHIKHLAIEMVASYGMSVGQTTFETVLWIGRFMERFGYDKCTKIYRKDVKLFLCNSLRAKDANIRQAILDLFPATGGGKTPQIGTKKQPGPLYGVTSHSISALAVGLTYKYYRG